MATKLNWRTLCRGMRTTVDGDDVAVFFDNGRSHRVSLQETTDAVELEAIVAGAAAVRDVPDLPLRIWQHNHAAQLVSFRIDERGRVRARGWIPKAGLTQEEFQLMLRRVANESDRLEFLLTGRDQQ
jgi:hypothetical protein